jgi:peptidoglycan-associated lipoprotein
MKNSMLLGKTSLAIAVVIGLAACSGYVKKTDFDATVAELRASDQKQQKEIDDLAAQMQQRFADYDAKIAAMAGRIRVDTIAHFGFNQSTLSEQDKPLLDDFAKTIAKSAPEALVTVEGFADPAGSRGYNMKLGRQRADAVRDYLVSTGGLSADRVRTVSYGEAANRQVLKGESGDAGEPNRRVNLVIDFAGAPKAP